MITGMVSGTEAAEIFVQVQACSAPATTASARCCSRRRTGRIRSAYDIVRGVPDIADIGIGQGQLVNLLTRHQATRKVQAYDFRKHSKLIEPEAGSYTFQTWDITKTPPFEPPPVDVVVAMEVLEHIAIAALPAVIARLRAMARHGALLITVPYRETAPLYHHDKPHGHKQSFDDTKIERLFGPSCLFSTTAHSQVVLRLDARRGTQGPISPNRRFQV